MNRLIIIGNGYDLAHGLKTSYKDFMFDYFNQILDELCRYNKYEDDLLSIPESNKHEAFISLRKYQEVNSKTLSGIISCIRNNQFEIKGKSYFIDIIISNIQVNNGWVDIENEYYKELKRLIYQFYPNLFALKSIIDLNNTFNSLKVKLEEYLNTIFPKNINQINPIIGMNGILDSKINYSDFIPNIYTKEVIGNFRNSNRINLRLTYILNFNYSNTIERYINLNNNNYKLNYIHGELGNIENPIIFGYGDEMDSKSEEILEFNSNELLTHFKSFMYGKTSNYHDLINFINTDEYEVYVMGHSCGLSDRTMFNRVFEDENCKLIKLFYYQNGDIDDFSEKYFNLSRHFKDKSKMRERILPKSKSQPFPQLTNNN